ncbi:MAG: carbohydrate-binding protein, partial [Clostridia bacterium]|nr:carbohydrate-binding protein [Clostridia bacterium]
AANAEKSSGVTIDSDGYAKFTASGEYLVFKNVDFGEGANEMLISYTGDSNWTYDKIEIRLDSADNDNVYKTTASVDSPDLNQTHTNRIAISAATGTHDVYVKVADYKSVRIGGVGVYDRSHAGETDDFTQYMYASAYTDVTRGSTTRFFTPELVQDGNNPAAPGVKDANVGTAGHVIRYADRHISADSDYFVLAAGSRLGSADSLEINIYTADTNTEKLQDMSAAVNIGRAKLVGTTRILNTEFYEMDPIVTALNETISAGTYDIYIELKGAGTANIEYFGFLKAGADLSKYRTQLRQWTGWCSEYTQSNNASKPLYWLSDVSEDHTYVINTFAGASLTYNKVKAVSNCTKLRVCYAAEDDRAGQPINVTVKNSSGTTVASSILNTAATNGEFVTQEINLSAAVTGSISNPSVYTVTLGFGGNGNQTCQVKWFEFAE